MASCPEEKLFQAIVMQAFVDACSRPRPQITKLKLKPTKAGRARFRDLDLWRAANRRRTFKERDEAREWLTGNGHDFRLICRYAGWEPEYISRAVDLTKVMGWKLPEEAKALAA